MATASTHSKAPFDARQRQRLRAFLARPGSIDCRPRPGSRPRVSVVVLVHNRADLTLACLQGLAAQRHATAFELIVLDNGSTDETPALLGRVRGHTLIHNRRNVGYPKGVNQAARRARADYLLLLNNDAVVLGGSIAAGVDFLDRHPDVGAVGGKVILLDGTLQEAGCSIEPDGTTRQFARGELPGHVTCAARRDVDYCSAAFLLTRRRLFRSLGGLDEAFSPGYYEDPDYCVRLWQAGYRVVYLPDIGIRHYENGTSGALLDLHEVCTRNHRRFLAKNAGWIANRHRTGARTSCTGSPLRRLLRLPVRLLRSFPDLPGAV